MIRNTHAGKQKTRQGPWDETRKNEKNFKSDMRTEHDSCYIKMQGLGQKDRCAETKYEEKRALERHSHARLERGPPSTLNNVPAQCTTKNHRKDARDKYLLQGTEIKKRMARGHGLDRGGERCLYECIDQKMTDEKPNGGRGGRKKHIIVSFAQSTRQ